MLPRAGSVLLPGFLFAAGVAMLIASPLAWGAGSNAGLADWQPPLVGVTIALPAMALGFMTLRAVGRKTRHRFIVHPVPLIFGIPLMLAGSVAVWSLVATVPDPATYNALLVSPSVSPDGPPGFAAAQRSVQFQDGMSPAGFLAVSLPLVAFIAGWVWAASYAYTTAFDADPLMKYEARQAQEVDAVGMLLRGERGPRGNH